MVFDNNTIITLGQKVKGNIYSQKILQILDEFQDGLSKQEIQKKTNLTKFTLDEAVNQLEGALFIDYIHHARAKLYFLTENGKVLVGIFKETGGNF